MEMSTNTRGGLDDTVKMRGVCPDDEPTQRIDIVALSAADTACAEWMQRARELAAKRRGNAQ